MLSELEDDGQLEAARSVLGQLRRYTNGIGAVFSIRRPEGAPKTHRLHEFAVGRALHDFALRAQSPDPRREGRDR